MNTIDIENLKPTVTIPKKITHS